MKISELVSQTVATGVPPMELLYRAVRNCHSYNPIAYRAQVAINSVELGRLTQSDFSVVSDHNDVGIRICDWAITNALKQRERFRKENRHPLWISVPCPAAYAELPDLPERIKKLLGTRYAETNIHLCLEFGEELLSSDKDIKQVLLDLKLLGVHTMLVCGEEGNCPFFRLSELPVDYVLLSKQMMALADDRNKPTVLPGLIGYLQSMRLHVLADGTRHNDHARMLYRLDCDGYLAADEGYLSLDEAVLQKEGDD